MRILLLVAVLGVVANVAPAGAQPTQARGQTGRVIGRILEGGMLQPLEGVAVRIVDGNAAPAFTTSDGRFAFPGLPPGVIQLEIRHLGYGTGTHLVNVVGGETVDLEIRLEPDPIALEGLRIEAEARVTRLDEVGFHRRQLRGAGNHYAGEDAEAWKVPQLLQNLPSTNVRGGTGRFVTFRVRGGDCVPDIYLDGILQRWAEGEFAAVTEGMPIEAIEVYRGAETPPEFRIRPVLPCGAILFWTRR